MIQNVTTIVSLLQMHTFRLMTATLFPGAEFLFSIAQVIDFRQGSTTYRKTQINAMILHSEKKDKQEQKQSKELFSIPRSREYHHSNEEIPGSFLENSSQKQFEQVHQHHSDEITSLLHLGVATTKRSYRTLMSSSSCHHSQSQ